MALAVALVELTFNLAALELTKGWPELILLSRASTVGEVGVSALEPFDAPLVVLVDWVSQGGVGAFGFDAVATVAPLVGDWLDCPFSSADKADGVSDTVTADKNPKSPRSPPLGESDFAI